MTLEHLREAVSGFTTNEARDFFTEQLTEVVPILGRVEQPRVPLTKSELAYVSDVLTDAMPKPLHLDRISDLLNTHLCGPHPLVEGEIQEVAESTLLLCGFFHRAGRLRGKGEYDLSYFANMGQFFYHQLYKRWGGRIQILMYEHFHVWINGLSLLDLHLETQRRRRLLLRGVTLD